MTDILVTKAAVRKLAASLSKIDTSSLRHTDRLDLIADALTLPAGAKLDQLGIRLLDSWTRAISSPSGLCLACGATGSGRTTTLEASARHLEGSGRRVYTKENLPRASHGGGDVVLFGDLRDRTTAEQIFDYADNGYLVLAVSPLFTVERTAEVLSGYGVDETRLGVVRGAISQHLVRLVCRECAAAGCDRCSHRGYKGRTLASHVVRFHGPDDVSDYLRAGDGVWHGLAGDVARKLADGRIDIKEIDRVFGGRMFRLLSDRHDLPQNILADLRAAAAKDWHSA